MSRKDKAPIVPSDRDDFGGNVYDSSPRAAERARTGLLFRRRNVLAAPYRVDTCPACGLGIRDSAVAQLGFCDRCREFTGMCGAGRRIICRDLMTRTSWHTPCTQLGTEAWEITQAQGRCRTMLCRVHDTQLRFGGLPWIQAAVPLDPASSGRGRRGASAIR
jgi:hypothetical protein